jgi:hypothetical protein
MGSESGGSDMNRQKFRVRHQTRESGVAILAITIILLLVATIGTMMVGRVGLFEQKLTGTDVRSKEVYAAATKGLEYGVMWVRKHKDESPAGLAEALASLPELDPTEMGADFYEHEITYNLKVKGSGADWEDGGPVIKPVVIEVVSKATAQQDSHVSKIVRVDVMIGSQPFFSPGGGKKANVLDGPPIMIEGCTTPGAVTGSPNVVYNYGEGVAIGTTAGTAGGVAMEECIDAADINVHLDLCDINNDPDSCSNSDAISAGEALAAGVEFRDALDEPQSLWATVFGANTSFADLKAMEKMYPENILIVDTSYPHYEGQPSWNGNTWHDNTGTAGEPVIIYFDASVGCPPINGNTTVHGLVYYAKVDCGNQGWGGGTVFGTVAKSGDLQKFNANATIVSTSLDFNYLGEEGEGGEGDDDIYDPGLGHKRFSEIPGSWRDF